MKDFVTSLCCILSLSLTSAISHATQISQIEGKTQGTTYAVQLPEAAPKDLKKKIEKLLSGFDEIFSNYRSDSEISRFNAYGRTDWFAVNPGLVQLVEIARGVSEDSSGAFDITVGPLMKLWGFGPFKRKDTKSPTSDQIAQALLHVGYKKLEFRKKPFSLRKLDPALWVDLSGIAQGYSVDKISELLDQEDIKNYLVEIGGEFRSRGQKSPGKGWIVAIESPSLEPDQMSRGVVLHDLSLTTAGDYREFIDRDGKHLSHTLDPRTGAPVQNDIASVTVLAKRAVDADAWDTACMVLGLDASRQLLSKRKLQAAIIYRVGSELKTSYLGGFKEIQ